LSLIQHLGILNLLREWRLVVVDSMVSLVCPAFAIDLHDVIDNVEIVINGIASR